MVYRSMYRQFRPQVFSEMAGQNHITRTLSNALNRGQLSHAYLFCGPRGTGKTTAAKIMARAMNCEQYPASEPCGDCNSCKNIGAGISIDVVEMDAASNRGIDEIRDLREKTRYSSGESRYKVYIIDEAHMLTTEACNAFLKTLEDPPQNVVFILATTDPSKLPTTIVSRCLRFDFRLLSVHDMVVYLETVLKRNSYNAENQALQLVGRLAGGSLRDALGILEKCFSYSQGILTVDQVRAVTGAAKFEEIDSLIAAIVENNFDKGLNALNIISFSGCDLSLFLQDITFIFSRLLLDNPANVSNDKGLFQGFEGLIQKYHGTIAKDRLLDLVNMLYEGSGEMKNTYYPQFVLEITFIRALRLLHAEVSKGEENVNNNEWSPDKNVSKSPQAKNDTEGSLLTVNKAADPVEVDISDSNKELADVESNNETEEEALKSLAAAWPTIIDMVKKQQKSTAAWLEPAALTGFKGKLIKLSYSPEYTIHQIRIMENSHRKIVEGVLSTYCKMEVNISAVIAETECNMVLGNDKLQPQGDDKPVTSDDAKALFGGTLVDLEGEEA